MSEIKVFLQEGKEKKVKGYYPWIQREEVDRFEGNGVSGSVASLYSSQNEFLAKGYYNEKSRFPFRILTLSEEEIGTQFFESRFESCYKYRKMLFPNSQCFRLAFAEADCLPGLIIDLYDGHAVVQVRTLGMENLKSFWMPALINVVNPKSIYERSDMEARTEEGLTPIKQQLYGETPDEIPFEEHGVHHISYIKQGMKTGFYLDQSDNRRKLQQIIKPGQKVLDAFCYTGGFALNAAKAGAEVTAIDILPNAIEWARKSASKNHLDIEFINANAFDWIVEANTLNRKFDWIILDPPAIAKTFAQRNSLKWAIWKLVHSSLDTLNEGGGLLVCNCSYFFNLKEMLDTVRMAANDKHRKLVVFDQTFQSPDHPYLLHFPESLYLKCLWLRDTG